MNKFLRVLTEKTAPYLSSEKKILENRDGKTLESNLLPLQNFPWHHYLMFSS